MLNNKGFVASVILYSITAVVVVVLLLILAVDRAGINNTGNMVEDIKKQVSGF